MFQLLIFLILIFNSILFLIMNHPLSMGLMLMTQTLLIALLTGKYSFTFWFSYSLFLIFMGGMLILFMYMTSIASNETFKFSVNMKLMMMKLMLIMLIIFMTIIFDFKILMFFENNLMNEENTSLYSMYNLMNKNNMMLNKMYNYPTNMITILLINYLFLTLIATVKITNIFKGPLRQNLKLNLNY